MLGDAPLPQRQLHSDGSPAAANWVTIRRDFCYHLTGPGVRRALKRENDFPVGSEEMRATTKYLTTARDLLVSVRDLLGGPHGTPEEVAKLREKLIPRFKEIDVTIPKIKSLAVTSRAQSNPELRD